jgi:hypothetical protein
MKTEHKAALKQVLVILTVGIVAFVVWEIIKAIRAGAKDVKSILLAPFTALGSVWTAVTGLFTSGPSVATPMPGTITDASGTPIASVATTSPFYSSFAPTPDQADTQAASNWLLGLTPGPTAPATYDLSTL